jgi:glycosyltransferase involved in cell wall biosynthesis
MKVVFWGTYDLGKPRTRILLSGLESAGVEVIQVHFDLWRGVEDKSRLGPFDRVLYGLRWVAAYPGLIVRYLAAPPHDAVIVAYLGQIDVLVLWAFAGLRRVPVLWDMFIPLYETVVEDRRLAKPGSVKTRILYALEWLGCRAADRVLLDTGPHARHVEATYALTPGKVGWVPVGSELEHFPRLPAVARGSGPAEILFYGQLIPLHGVHTILEAARAERGRAYRWRLIGSGQEEALVRAFLDANPLEHFVWEPWVPYEALRQRIASAHVCLGIFGTSGKAASVVPNKAYQVLLAGRSLITRDSPAMRELLAPDTPGVRLVPPADPEALLDAIAALEQEGWPQPPKALRSEFSPRAIGARLRGEIEGVVQNH